MKYELTEEEKKLLERIRSAAEFVLIEDKKLFKELGKK